MTHEDEINEIGTRMAKTRIGIVDSILAGKTDNELRDMFAKMDERQKIIDALPASEKWRRCGLI